MISNTRFLLVAVVLVLAGFANRADGTPSPRSVTAKLGLLRERSAQADPSTTPLESLIAFQAYSLHRDANDNPAFSIAVDPLGSAAAVAILPVTANFSLTNPFDGLDIQITGLQLVGNIKSSLHPGTLVPLACGHVSPDAVDPAGQSIFPRVAAGSSAVVAIPMNVTVPMASDSLVLQELMLACASSTSAATNGMAAETPAPTPQHNLSLPPGAPDVSALQRSSAAAAAELQPVATQHEMPSLLTSWSGTVTLMAFQHMAFGLTIPIAQTKQVTGAEFAIPCPAVVTKYAESATVTATKLRTC
ncbi:hypothetical protein BC828DRAFT_379880 [Blastocladiella britannica]|nr:hypothetical protein BC828DRAFT_379880 [Blastocladiella britannica]